MSRLKSVVFVAFFVLIKTLTEAISDDTDQIPHSAESDLGLRCMD